MCHDVFVCVCVCVCVCVTHNPSRQIYTCVTWLNQFMSDMAHSKHVWHDSFNSCVTWLIQNMCDMTHSKHVCHDLRVPRHPCVLHAFNESAPHAHMHTCAHVTHTWMMCHTLHSSCGLDVASWVSTDMHLDNYEFQKIGTNFNVLFGAFKWPV